MEGPPVSAQARNRVNLWKCREKVAAAARSNLPSDWQPLDGDVDLNVTYYQLGNWRGDNDNMVKPIQDALQGIAYRNDNQIRNQSVKRRHLKGRYTVHRISLVLAHAFAKGPEFLHIRVEKSPAIEDLG